MRPTLVVLFILLVSTPLFSQTTTGTIEGTVKVDTGEALPNTRVVATNEATGLTRQTTSDGDGFYRFSALLPGVYSVSVDLQNFSAQNRAGVQVIVGQTATVNFEMRMAAAEAITVESESPLVDLTKSSVGLPVKEQQIENLPLNSRNFQELASLVPGASPSPSYDPTKKRIGGVTFAGSTARGGTISIDGGSYDDDIVGGPVGLVPEDAIREFQVYTNRYSAEIGRAATGAINVVTKSGTNDIHGSAFALFRDKSLNSKNFFETEKAPYDRQQIGGSIGGPIVKNKSFFFLSYQRTNEDTSGFVDTGGIYPQFEGSFPTPFDDTMLLARADFQLSDQQNVNVRYSHQGNDVTEQLIVDPNVGYGGPPAENANQIASNRINSIIGNHTWLLSDRSLNQLRFHFIRFENALDPTSTGEPSLRFPSIVVGQNASTPQAVKQDRIQFGDEYSFSASAHGRHEIKMGADVNLLSVNLLFDLFKGGAFFFEADDPTLGQNVQPFLAILGVGSTVLNDFKYQQYGFYVQDDWHPLENLTLNLGLRYDLETGLLKHEDFPHPLAGRGIWFVDGVEAKNDTNNFAPRIGFAWNPKNDTRTVLRGGYGIYYDVTVSEIATVPIVFDGFRYAFVFIGDPGTTDVDFLRSQLDPSTIVPSGNITPPGQEEPYTQQFNLGFSRQFAGEAAINVDYVHILSLHEWVSQELNPSDLNQVRPFREIGSFVDFESSGRSTYDGLQVSFEKQLTKESQVLVSYTLSKHTNIGDDIFSAFNPANSFDFENERGPSLRDQRHRFVLSGVWQLPYEFQISGIFTAASARPFNVITGSDDNGDGWLRDRPPGVERNSERGSNFVNLDLRVSKRFVWEPMSIELVADFFNITNHVNYDPESFNGNLSSGENFGQPSVAFNPRQIQFGARVQF
jgi:Carboxypeptidase regulatory-like domain/TonB dependent receptor-like, beta-barrel